jgi:hypothetical protein
MPPTGYWYWGYDFATPDLMQSIVPKFVNRSGRTLTLVLSFTIQGPPCAGRCLPGVEFYFDQGVHKRDPKLLIDGNTAKAAVTINNGDSYGFVIGLWQARDPVVSVVDGKGLPVPPDQAGLSAHPDESTFIPGIVTQCDCMDGETADCNLGGHYTNGLSGEWVNGESLARLGAWTYCQHGGT